MSFYSVPEFESSDVGSRPLDISFLLATRLGDPQGLLRYSEGVNLAVRMLLNPDDRKVFIRIAKILAFSEIQTRNNMRLRSISWQDIADLNNQEKNRFNLLSPEYTHTPQSCR